MNFIRIIFSIFIIFGLFLTPQTIFADNHIQTDNLKKIDDNFSTITVPDGKQNVDFSNQVSNVQGGIIESEKIVLLYPGNLCGEGTEFKDGLCTIKSSDDQSHLCGEGTKFNNGKCEVISETKPILDIKNIDSGYTLFLFLLLLYYIPSQSIERIVEFFDLHKFAGRGIKGMRFESFRRFIPMQDQLESLKKIREKKYQDNSSYKITYVDMEIPNISEKNENNNKKSGLLSDSKDISLARLNAKISELNHKINNQKTIRMGIFFAFSLTLAIIPGVLIAENGFGPLYIVEEINTGKKADPTNEENKMHNAIANILFITTGTQPIHKIIELIPKVRKPSS